MIFIMHETNLAGVDLNLLVALQALLEERSVTRAAHRVGLTQPAMSRALGRLRALFDDPLLVRATGGMAPTPRAESLSEPLRQTLAEVDRMIRRPTFEPATARGKLRITSTDYVTPVVLPRVLGRLFKEAPHLDLELQHWNRDSLRQLEDGSLDLAIGLFPDAPAGFYRQRLFSDDFACIVRAKHPVTREGLTLEAYTSLRHALITVAGEERGAADAALERLGLTRRIALRIPHFLAAPLIVAESDLVLTLPRRLARRFARFANLTFMDPPVEIGGFTISQLWHERRHHDPAHLWLRALLAERTRRL